MKERQPGWFGQNGLLTKLVGVAGKYLEGKTARMVWSEWFTNQGGGRSREVS